MNPNNIELLAPAGSYEGFEAALGAGADAVYVGGAMFGARAYAQNFNEEELLRAIDVAHIHGKKLYLTVNTLLKNRELKEILIQDDTIKTALQLAQNADVILTSVGSVEYKTWENYLGESTFHLLGNKGAVGHIGGHFYDINGKEINTSLNDRMIGIGYDDLKRWKNVVCVAYGEAKAEAVAGALRGGFINTLIIDSACGEKLL